MPELTEDDLEVAEASIRFALQSCPVEGVLTGPNGAPVTYDSLQTLLEKLVESENRSDSGPQLGDDVLSQLKEVIGYTSENCPVENVSTFHDGRPILGVNVLALANKLSNLE
ncbi:MAG TPA: hypothetical protein VEI80_00215 [Candidatus Acidoferrales bacterium]|nr:hypothetical protein [Candidatus Acidoferrales bacterium]